MKRIIICADGTWNVRDQENEITRTRRPTNVTKVARAVLPRDAHGIDQVVYYHDGVGTGGKLDELSGGAFGQGIDDNIRNLYRFIAYNWAPGDELFFFGFSRGAFTVRTLAGFMDFIGLAEKDDDYYVPEMDNHVFIVKKVFARKDARFYAISAGSNAASRTQRKTSAR